MRDPAFNHELREKIVAHQIPLPPLPKNIFKKKLKDDFPRGIKFSAWLHFGILATAFFLSLLNRLLGWDSEREARLKMNQMAKTAIRVDVVNLPKLKLSELSKIDLTEEIVPESKIETVEKVKTPTEVSKGTMVDKTQSSVEVAPTAPNTASKNRLKALRDSLKAEQRRKELAEELKAGAQKKSGRAELAGNILSEGYSLTGDLATEQDAFQGKIQAHLLKNWSVPAWMNASTLKSIVLLKVAPDGRIIEKQFLKRSGDAVFDAAVERAVELSDPLPAPPESLRRNFLEEGIECSFPR